MLKHYISDKIKILLLFNVKIIVLYYFQEKALINEPYFKPTQVNKFCKL